MTGRREAGLEKDGSTRLISDSLSRRRPHRRRLPRPPPLRQKHLLLNRAVSHVQGSRRRGARAGSRARRHAGRPTNVNTMHRTGATRRTFHDEPIEGRREIRRERAGVQPCQNAKDQPNPAIDRAPHRQQSESDESSGPPSTERAPAGFPWHWRSLNLEVTITLRVAWYEQSGMVVSTGRKRIPERGNLADSSHVMRRSGAPSRKASHNNVAGRFGT